MRTINLLLQKNSSTKEYTISIKETSYVGSGEEAVAVDKELFEFNYSANDMYAEHWHSVFCEIMRDGSDDFTVGKLIFDLSVVDYDAAIDLPENGLFKFRIFKAFAQKADKALFIKAGEIKKK